MTIETLTKLEQDWDRFYYELNNQEYQGHDKVLDSNISLLGKITRE